MIQVFFSESNLTVESSVWEEHTWAFCHSHINTTMKLEPEKLNQLAQQWSIQPVATRWKQRVISLKILK